MIPVFSKETLDAFQITYDMALPQTIYDDITAVLGGDNPLCHIVMVYPAHKSDLAGLVAVTPTGAAMLEWYYAERHFSSRSQKA